MAACRLLFLAANPEDTSPLALDEECREIELKIRGSEYRDSLEQVTKWAVRPDDLLQFLNQYRPHIVHFSGHGSSSDEIMLQDASRQSRPVSTEALRALFATLKDNVRVVVFNACYSRAQALAITEVIDCAIGMNREIGDDAARVFASAFYRAIGFGRSLQDAYDQGKAALLLEGIPEEKTPELLVREGVSPASIVLIEREVDAAHIGARAPSVSTTASAMSAFREAPAQSSRRLDLERFERIKLLGETGHSAIHSCRYNGKLVALKRTRSELCDLDALRAVVAAGSDAFGGWPGDVRAVVGTPRAAWEQEGFVWEVYDFYEGVSLGALINRHRQSIGGPFLKRCTEALVDILFALSKTGLVHRDISPFNLFVTTSGELRLIDWTSCALASRQTAPMVTAGYTAPEQQRGDAGPASDWYSLAATLYFMANATPPSSEPDPGRPEGLRTLERAVGERFEYFLQDEWHVGLATFCEGLLAANPEARPVPSRSGWTPISLPTWQAAFRELDVFQMSRSAHLVLGQSGYWFLPNDLERFEERLGWMGAPPAPEIEALVRRYRSTA
jgi:hypothetical protein